MSSTNIRIIFCLYITFAVLLSVLFLPAAALTPAIISRINEAVFEVVIPKPDTDPLQYEKELPFHLLPFGIRNDKYMSVGTAFSSSRQKFITAAHVLDLEILTSFSNIFIRSSKGEIFTVNFIERYSKNRDFAVFTIKEDRTNTTLGFNLTPEINSTVYAVGNALGEGIVIRDGLLTSETPEEESGAWKWLRFSAAASPGNSGGPLLDQSGKVIGVVLRKSENENLNYALRLSEIVNSGKNIADYHLKITYKTDLCEKYSTFPIDFKLALSLNIHELRSQMSKELGSNIRLALDHYLTEHNADFFPSGKNSELLLHKIYYAAIPHIICQNNNGIWDAFTPANPAESFPENDIYFYHGTFSRHIFFNLKTTNESLYSGILTAGKPFFPVFMKAIPYSREVGSQNIRITNTAEIPMRAEFTDKWNRVWIIYRWNLPYENERLLVYLLPRPDGFIGFATMDQTGILEAIINPDCELIAGHIYCTYEGTIDAWQKFLKLTDIIPEPLSKISISDVLPPVPNKEEGNVQNSSSDQNAGQGKISCPFFTMNFNKILPLRTESVLIINMDFFRFNNQVQWDMRTVQFCDSYKKNTHFILSRQIKPPESLGKEQIDQWTTMINKTTPYDQVARFFNEHTIINSSRDIDEKQESLYITSLYLNGKIKDKTTRSIMTALNNCLTLHEKR
ncbi:MAG: hypothetical protein A2096_06845 [Spirochaetes bacterium GWF1_41_5]|nr:MAG: hypothetical protein A2096_06845 [Spirochaetes bacterium GWF1_41_5]HBE04025.1 hypothetical protein [Spirochaetia bacterium]